MIIQVLGSGCPTCKKLYEMTKEAVKELELKTEVEYITDIQQIVSMGVMSSPVLAINGKPVLTGFPSDQGKIKSLIEDNLKSDKVGRASTKKTEDCCSGKDVCDCSGKSDTQSCCG